jgi:hypothetical protein
MQAERLLFSMKVHRESAGQKNNTQRWAVGLQWSTNHEKPDKG